MSRFRNVMRAVRAVRRAALDERFPAALFPADRFPPHPFFPAILVAALFAWGGVDVASAQSATATLSGTIVDQSGAVVPDVEIVVVNVGTRLERPTATNAHGQFAIPLLPLGHYRLTAQRDGFAPLQVPDVVLNVNDQVALQLRLQVASIGEAVSVVVEPPRVRTSPAVSTVVDRQFVENLPLNGRSFQSLIALTPGVTFTKDAYTTGGGQFSVNGQRSNANYFTVDGVSANFGIDRARLLQSGGGTAPGFSSAGGTNNLVSVDALQEFAFRRPRTPRSSAVSRAARFRSPADRGRTSFTARSSTTCGMTPWMPMTGSPTPTACQSRRCASRISAA